MKGLLKVLSVGVAMASAPTHTQTTTSGKTAATVTTQLPRSARPISYDITVTPDAAKLSFAGKVRIAIEITAPTATITLNQADLAIQSATLANTGGASLGPLRIALDNDAQTATFTASHTLAPGRYALDIAYTGKIYTQSSGLFALDYDVDGKSKRALYTQFENSDARRFVPSWDEPFYKAIFTLKAVVPAGEMAVSNLPVASRAPAGVGRELVTFDATPKMSSYLLFFGLGDFERATVKAGGAEIGLVTKRGSLASGRYALDSAAAILPWYNAYFGVPYPLPKLDHIAGAGQSQTFGAMENWGAIFYFEYALLLDPSISSEADRQTVFSVVAHEMAHQWFGDLVTMSWWDDLWLNEGFASWMAGRATEHFHPDWHAELDAVTARASAFSQDALATTHPVIQHVATVDQAAQAFDSITYSKGEAVLRMLEGYAGPTAWRDGVRAYMRKYAYQNTVTDDLWREVDRTSGKPVSEIAHEFTRQPGVPLISATATCAGGRTPLRYEQGEFTKDRPDKRPLRWHVPVAAAAPGATPVVTLVDGSGTAMVPGCGAVVVNAGQTGYFRTRYAPDMFAKLVAAFATVAPVDQIALYEDALSLGLGGAAPLSNLLDLIQVLPAKADPQVVGQALGDLDALIDPYSKEVPARRSALAKLAAAKFLPLLDRMGWAPIAGESVPVANLRSQLIATLGSIGVPSVVAEAKRRFAASASDPGAIPPSLRKPILSVVAANADSATWDKLQAMAKAETSTIAKEQLYMLLGTASDPALADRALALVLTKEPGATTSPAMISAVANEFPDRAFDFVVAHQQTIMAMIDANAATRFVPRLVYSGYEPGTASKLRDWAQANLKPDAMRTADQSIAQIQYRALVRADRMPAVDKWLVAKGYER